MDGEFIGLISVILIFGIPLSAIWTSHKQKVLEMQLKLRGSHDENLRAEIEALRNEMRSLRDTTTQYDLSFDNALQRMEKRMENLETRSSTSTQPEYERINTHLR